MLDGPHQIQLDRRRIALQFGDLQLPDAMLGAEAAAEFMHQLMDRALHLMGPGQESRGRHQWILVEIEMQVAVPDVSVGNQAALGHVAGDPGGGLLHEPRQRGYRHRNIMLEACTIEALGARNVLAQEPEAGGLAAALRDGGIRHQPRAMGLGQDLLEYAVQGFIGAWRSQFAQHVPVVAFG